MATYYPDNKALYMEVVTNKDLNLINLRVQSSADYVDRNAHLRLRYSAHMKSIED